MVGPSLPASVVPCSRRTHRKSRAGCRVCKTRKVKCDETKPQCNNCTKRRIACEYPTLTLTSIWNLPDAPPSPSATGTTGSLTARSDSQLDLDLMDMELLHHYSTSTYHTLRSDPVQRTIWQTIVCEIGFSNVFVLREILAIAALHLAYLRPGKRRVYTTRALTHHQIGLSTATELLATIDNENCTPLCVFSGLAAMFAMASPRTAEDFLIFDKKGLADWIVLLRGMNSIIDSSESVLYTGPLALIFRNGNQRSRLRDTRPFMLGSEHDDEVKLLQQRILEFCVIPEHVEIYTGALTELRKSYAAIFTNADVYDPSDALIWLFKIPEGYFELLAKREQNALCTFAFFCVVLHKLSENWWAQGWSLHLMLQVYQLLDAEHHSWIDWPLEQLGGFANLHQAIQNPNTGLN